MLGNYPLIEPTRQPTPQDTSLPYSDYTTMIGSVNTHTNPINGNSNLESGIITGGRSEEESNSCLLVFEVVEKHVATLCIRWVTECLSERIGARRALTVVSSRFLL